MDSLIIKRAERKARQSIFGGVLLLVTVLMLVNTFGWVWGAVTNANVTFNIDAGSFTISNGPTEVRFGNISFGQSGNIKSANEVDDMQVTDYRGNAQAWGVVVNAANLTAGSNELNTDKIALFANQIIFTNVESFTTSYMNRGANGAINGTGFSMVNGSTQASGIVQFDNGFFNLTHNGSEVAGTYTGVIQFTLS